MTTNNHGLRTSSTTSSFEKKLEEQHNRTRLNVGAVATLILSFKTLGVIYGDIGTSPLYVLTSIFSEPPSDERDVIGICSLIIWSLTIVPLIKYVFLVLRADDNGEGGTFALYSLLSRHSDLSIRGKQRPEDLTIVNYETSSTRSTKKHPNILARYKFMENLLLIVVLFGASLVMSDGLLTPAVSVISAIEGIAVPAPSLQASIVPISCAIIVLLFFGQRFGTNKVGFLFAPIVFLWLLIIGITGVWNITHYPKIMTSFSPTHIFTYFIRNKSVGFGSLGGVMLSITGVEALYADLGHFNRLSIQISFPFFVYPTLIMAYLGQGARIIKDPSIVSNTFYNSIPDNDVIYWITFVFATFATIIASQAMISATFSLVYQAMQLDCFPRVKVIHTSKDVKGQIYIPEVNYFLMIVIIIICIVFKKSANLTNAYGVAVASVMLITTILLSLTFRIVWKFPIIFSIVFLLIFGTIDMAFLISTLRKFKEGGWFTILLGSILCLMMVIWKWGSTFRYQHELKSKTRLENIFINDDDLDEPEKGSVKIEERVVSSEPSSKKTSFDEKRQSSEIIISDRGSKELTLNENIKNIKTKSQIRLVNSGFQVSRLPGIGMFYNESGFGVPLVFRHFIQHFPAVPKTLLFISIRPVAIPHVGEDDRLVVSKVSNYDGCYRVIARYGYMESISQGQDFVTKMVEAIHKLDPDHQEQDLKRVTYVVGQQSLYPKSNSNWFKRLIIFLYVFLTNNSRQLYGNWNIPVDDVIEVGMKIPL